VRRKEYDYLCTLLFLGLAVSVRVLVPFVMFHSSPSLIISYLLVLINVRHAFHSTFASSSLATNQSVE